MAALGASRIRHGAAAQRRCAPIQCHLNRMPLIGHSQNTAHSIYQKVRSSSASTPSGGSGDQCLDEPSSRAWRAGSWQCRMRRIRVSCPLVNPRRSALGQFLQLVALSAFAVGQPLLDLLANFPGFLVAHRSAPIDVALLALTLIAALPLALFALTRIVGRMSRRAETIVHGTSVAALACLIVLPWDWALRIRWVRWSQCPAMRWPKGCSSAMRS